MHKMIKISKRYMRAPEEKGARGRNNDLNRKKYIYIYQIPLSGDGIGK